MLHQIVADTVQATAYPVVAQQAAGQRCRGADLRRDAPGDGSDRGAGEQETRRALDSTVLDDAVARQDTVTMLQAPVPPGPQGGPGVGRGVGAGA